MIVVVVAEQDKSAMYGLDPINGGDTLAIWVGSGVEGHCEEVILYSSVNMITGEDGIEKGYLPGEPLEEDLNEPLEEEKKDPI